MPTAYGKDKIWEHLQTLQPIPDVSQFLIYAGRQDVSKNDKWPVGEIVAVPHTFSVRWEFENPQAASGFDEVVQEKMTPIVTAMEAWGLLHNEVPRLFEEATLDFRGKLRPGLTIKAEIVWKQPRVGVEFEVIRKGKIRFIHELRFMRTLPTRISGSRPLPVMWTKRKGRTLRTCFSNSG